MIHFRDVSHRQFLARISGDDLLIRNDTTRSVVPWLHDMSNKFNEAFVYNSHHVSRPPEMRCVERQMRRSKPIRPVIESLQTAAINSMVGFGFGALGSWYWCISVLNPYVLAAGLTTGAISGVWQYAVLCSGKVQDRLLLDIACVSRFYTENPGHYDPQVEMDVRELRHLCYAAGGVAAARFRALDAALKEQGVCQNG